MAGLVRVRACVVACRVLREQVACAHELCESPRAETRLTIYRAQQVLHDIYGVSGQRVTALGQNGAKHSPPAYGSQLPKW